ncbi:hypothetical protein ONS95_013985 [Cadophora gregata]|uniref:uncharacterized protein n=1 Tax=Cadophora gregata TaxID=51156 RepID=UPI0026DCDB8D|nr:uncharacterized protein ONS95_013985 [Cadophora gregata]KAK0114493.1 hypothetical protein ONS95_013985 [Cadophora gregata]
MMARDQILEEDILDHLHPLPFPSYDTDAAKAWLADPQSQDLSAWNQEKASMSGIWPILEGLIAEVIGIQLSAVRYGAYSVCREEWGGRPMIKRLDHDTQNRIIKRYTEILQNQCKKEWRRDVAPWISSALRTWIGRAICLWKNHEKGTKLYAEKHKAKIHKIAAVDECPINLTRNIVEEKLPPLIQPKSKTEAIANDHIQPAMMRPICKEYDEIVNHIVRTSEVHGNYNLELQPSWHGYKKDPFDSTAKKFRRLLKDRIIEDGIVKQSNRVGVYRSLAGVHLDHSVRYEDYPDRGLCRWIEDYFSEGYGVTVKAAIHKIILHCQQSPQGVYVPPIHRPDVASPPSIALASQESSQLNPVMSATSDCGEYLDFINKIVRKALHYSYPQTIYEIDFQLSSEAFHHQRAELLVGRVFRRMVKVRTVQLRPENRAYQSFRTIYLNILVVQCTAGMNCVRNSKLNASICPGDCRHRRPDLGSTLPVINPCCGLKGFLTSTLTA